MNGRTGNLTLLGSPWYQSKLPVPSPLILSFWNSTKIDSLWKCVRPGPKLLNSSKFNRLVKRNIYRKPSFSQQQTFRVLVLTLFSNIESAAVWRVDLCDARGETAWRIGGVKASLCVCCFQSCLRDMSENGVCPQITTLMPKIVINHWKFGLQTHPRWWISLPKFGFQHVSNKK